MIVLKSMIDVILCTSIIRGVIMETEAGSVRNSLVSLVDDMVMPFKSNRIRVSNSVAFAVEPQTNMINMGKIFFILRVQRYKKKPYLGTKKCN
jgi:hypothetical protein